MQNRQQKRSRFTAPGLAGNQQVGEFCFFVSVLVVQRLHGFRNGRHLHRSGLGKAHVCHSLQQFFGQAQFYKAIWLGRDGVQRCLQQVGVVVAFRGKVCFGKRITASLKRVSHVFSH